MPGEVRLMMLGDSITEGYNPPENISATTEPWEVGPRLRIAERAALAGYVLEMVGPRNHGYFTQNAHAGWNGYPIEYLRDGDTLGAVGAVTPGVDTWIPLYAPDVVGLMAGTNNAVGGNTGAQMLTLMESLIDAIIALDAGLHIVVSTLPTTFAFNPTAVPIFNAGLPALIDSYANPLIHYANAGGSLLDSDMYDVHPSTAGYAKLGDAWWTYLQPVFDTIDGGSIADAHTHG